MSRINPFLWFNGNAEEAVNFYVSVFKEATILHVARYGEAGPGKPGSVMTMKFKLLEQEFVAINGNAPFQFTEAISFVINCNNQEEVDHYWSKLTDGGKEVACGWLKDKYGLSWQVVPTILPKYLMDTDRDRANRVMKAMMQMKKIDIPELQRAYESIA